MEFVVIDGITDLRSEWPTSPVSPKIHENSHVPLQHLQILANVSKAFSESGLEQDRAISTIAATIAEKIGDACVIRLLSHDKEWLTTVAFEHYDIERKRLFQPVLNLTPYRIHEGLVGKVFQTRKTHQIKAERGENLNGLFKAEYQHLAELHRIQNILVSPLLVSGACIGTLGVFSHAGGREFTQDDILLVEELAERAALQLEQTRLYKEAREALILLHKAHQLSEERLKATLMGSPGPVVVTKGAEHFIDLTNEAYKKMLPQAADFLPQVMRSLLSPENAAKLHETLDHVFSTGERAEIKTLPIFENFYDWTCQPLRNLDGQVSGLVMQGIDVTETIALRRRSLDAPAILLDF